MNKITSLGSVLVHKEQTTNPTLKKILTLLVKKKQGESAKTVLAYLTGKASDVWLFAGVTRAIQTKVKIHENPNICLVDTPGVLNPQLKSPIKDLDSRWWDQPKTPSQMNSLLLNTYCFD